MTITSPVEDGVVAHPNTQSAREPPRLQPTRSKPVAQKADDNTRFSTLPEDRRPESISVRAEPADPDSGFDLEELLEEPLIDVFWPSLSRFEEYASVKSTDSAKQLLPSASFVPSFHLAASNRLFEYDFHPLRPALFVCGTLMFPSILKACAEHYISEDGVYSSKLQRRLHTSSSDWASIDVSLQSAAECMTPAVIRGFVDCSVKRRPWACAAPASPGVFSYRPGQDIPKDQPEVHGFLITGLSDEAYQCLDHWHNEELPSRLGFARKPSKSTKGATQANPKPLFARTTIYAEFEQPHKSRATKRAIMYQCLDHRYDLQAGQSPSILPPWDANAFLRSSAFTQLCGGTKSASWLREERRLAETMRIRFLMRGDVLCSAVLRGDGEKVMEYVEKGYDVNAKCRTFGTALQAAAAKGQDDIAMMLVEEGADVNTPGGRYKTPLIAAVVHGREDLVKYLLRNRADVLAPGGRYVNALYQAVSFSDVAMAHILLEKGAWLTKDYLEILDFAAENGNRSIMRMLEDYDVRGLSKKKLLDQRASDPASDPGDALTYVPYDERRAMAKPKTLTMVRAVVLEAFALKGQRGKWTGIKAVRVLQTALRMGASDSLIDKITPSLSSYDQLVQLICKASKQHAEEQRALQDADNSRGPREIERSDTSSRPDRTQDVLPRRRAPSPPRTYTSGYYEDRSRPSTAIDEFGVFCLTCNGRGGRMGTERTCNECNGSTTVWERQGPHSTRRTCPTCQGKGYTFSSRDVCQACIRNGDDAITTVPESPARQVRFEDVPPPYSP
jgi:hypothetical protein